MKITTRCNFSPAAVLTAMLSAAASLGVVQAAATAEGLASSPAASETTTANEGQAYEQRLALVIGNSSYHDAPLGNPANDARAMAITLKELGFKVTERENATLEEMRKSVRDFGNQLALGAVGLFYYAGHGIQSGGTNYLIPVDADIQDETELATRAFSAGEVLEKMDAAKNRINIVILDACRNNPLTRKVRSAGHGLAPMEQGSGTIIAFATKPGSTSTDGEGSHGLYTGELLQALSHPGLSVEEVFKQVRLEVSRKSGGEQIPWENSSLLGDFYFNPAAGQASPQRLATAPAQRSVYSESSGARNRDFAAKVLVPRRLLENYQLTANFPLSASVTVGEFSPDTRHFIMVTEDRQLKVLDPATGNVSFSHAGFDLPNVTADGRYVVGVSDEHSVNLIDTAADDYAVKSYRAVREVERVLISPNGLRALVISRSGTAAILKLDTDTVVGSPLKIQGEPIMQFSPSGNRVAVWNTTNGDLVLIDVDSGKRVGRTSAHRKPINLVRFSQDGNALLTATEGDAAYVWRTSDGGKIARLDLGDKSPLPGHAEFVDDGRRLLIHVAELNKLTGTHYRLGIWDATTGKLVNTLMPDTPISDMQFSLDRQQLYVTTSDHSVRVFDMNTKSARLTLSGAELIGFSSDGSRMLAREGNGIRLYDARTLTPIARMPDQVAAFIAPKTNGLFATAGDDGSLRLWEFEHGDPVSLLKGHMDTISRVNFADGGKRLVSFSRERLAKFWGLPSVDGADKLHKDTYESTNDYEKRVAEWSSPFSSLVELGDYNADAETFTVKVGDYSFPVPVPRGDARRFAGQREAMLTGRLKFFDGEQLQLGEGKLERLP